jgi:DNA polymerase alpha subunit A
MDGTDVARIAECLGLDTNKFHIGVAAEEAEQEELYTLDSQISDEERFKDAEKLNVRCRGCQQRFDIASIARLEVSVQVLCMRMLRYLYRYCGLILLMCIG